MVAAALWRMVCATCHSDGGHLGARSRWEPAACHRSADGPPRVTAMARSRGAAASRVLVRGCMRRFRSRCRLRSRFYRDADSDRDPHPADPARDSYLGVFPRSVSRCLSSRIFIRGLKLARKSPRSASRCLCAYAFSSVALYPADLRADAWS